MIRAFSSLLTALALAAIAVAAPAAAPAAKPAITDYFIGDANAKVTMIEYGSVSCPHCAHFAADVFPHIESRWIKTGKVKFIFRETPIHGDIDVAGFMVARCAGPENYFSVIEALFEGQDQLFKDKDVKAWLNRAGAQFGMDDAKVAACIEDASVGVPLAQHEQAEAQAMHVDETPTVFINGKRVKTPTAANLDKAILAAEGAHPSAAPHRKR